MSQGRQVCVIEYDCSNEFMRDVGSKTFGAYDEFEEAFTPFEKVINYNLEITVLLGYWLRVLNRVRSC